MLRIVTSTSAAARLAAAAHALATRLPSEETLIIGASRGAADDLTRAVTRRAGATFGVIRFSLTELAARAAAVQLEFGFMDAPDVPAALARAGDQGLAFQPDDTTYYLAHLTLFVHQIGRLGMMEWRDKLFVFLSRNARRATNFFQIPPDRVVEIGIQLEI